MPLWLWVKHYSAWPLTAYILSAAFDHNKAPFFQSFVEVQVHNAKDEVHFIPHGANGRLRWRELENFRALMPRAKPRTITSRLSSACRRGKRPAGV